MKEKSYPLAGNCAIQEKLENILKNDDASHAYIFYGPRHVGKRTFAQRFAKKLIQKSLSWFEEEDSAQFVQNAIVRIQPERDPKEEKVNSEIKIESIRKMRRLLAVGNTRERKICIIEDANAMNSESQNAILKVLEEPKEGVIFLLVSDTLGGLLPTVISRCQTLAFSLVGDEDMIRYKQEKEYVGDFERIISLSFGRPGRMIQCIEDENFLKQRDVLMRFLGSFRRRSLFEKISFAEKISTKPERLRELLEDWIELERRKSRIYNQDLLRESYEYIEKLEGSYQTLRQTRVNEKRIMSALFLSL